MSNKVNKIISLNNHILATLKKVSIYPMIILLLFFLIFHYTVHSWYQKVLVSSLEQEVESKIEEVSNMQKEIISNRLIEIENLSKFYSMNIIDSLNGNNQISLIDKDRLGFSEEGVYYTKKDKTPSGIAVFYSGFMEIGEKEIQKVHKLFSSEKFMINLLKSNPLVSSIYFNSFDTLNIIYPYFEVLQQFPPKIDVREMNFYYEADPEHNPEKKPVWTDAYLDPAGHGWLISSLAPVYIGNFIEGVTGIDITIETITKSILDLNIPWDGYGLLINKEGIILATPSKGELDWNIKELTKHTYNNIIIENTFKPENFNIVFNNPDNEVIKEIMQSEKGTSKIFLKGKEKFISWRTIPQTGWKLMILADGTKVLEPVNNVLKRIETFEWFVLILFILFQLIYLTYIIKKSYRISNDISYPLICIEEAFSDIEKGNFNPKIPEFEVKEFRATSEKLLTMGKILDNNISTREKAQKELIDYQTSLEEIIDQRTKKLKETNTELEKINLALKKLQGELVHKEKLASIGKLAAGLSHEINNPLSFVNSNLNTLKKYHEIFNDFDKEMSQVIKNSITDKVSILENSITELKEKYQIEYILEDSAYVFEESNEGINRIKEIINNLKNFSNIDEENEQGMIFNVNDSITSTIEVLKNSFDGYTNIELNLNSKDNIFCNKGELNQVISNIIMNAFYSIKEKHLENTGLLKVNTLDMEDFVQICIEDNGKGMSKEIIDKIFDPFFTTKPIGAGTGLGLYITYDIIVNKMKGKIEVKSELEKFTRFTILIPKLLEKE